MAQTFDAVVDDRTAYILPQEDWPEIAARYYRWLNDGGICILHTVNFGDESLRNAFEQAFLSVGFTEVEPRKSAKATKQKSVSFIYGSG
jgi:cyclopropane fatty-acyl-phospholipid synthase-like methyltransferase